MKKETSKEKLTSQEKLLLNTQIIQFASINLNTMILAFQSLQQSGGDVFDRLDEMIDLYNETNKSIEEIRDNLLNTLDSWDALGEMDRDIINPILGAIRDTNELKK